MMINQQDGVGEQVVSTEDRLCAEGWMEATIDGDRLKKGSAAC